MRQAAALAIVLCLSAALWAKAPACLLPPCPSPHAQSEARKLYEKALKLAVAGETRQAYDTLQQVTELDGQNATYLTARELAKEQLAHEHIARGNAFLAQKLPAAATPEFAAALRLDPQNDFAAQRLRDAMGAEQPVKLSHEVQIVEESGPVEVEPQPGRHDFDFRGDSRALFQAVTQAYGIRAQFDDTMTSRPVRMTVQNVDFAAAMSIAARLTKAFWLPVARDQVLIAADTPDARRQLEPVGLRTFYLKNASTPQELTEIIGLLRGIFEVRYVSVSPAQDVVTVRAPETTMKAIERFLDYLPGARPQVMLDVHVFAVSQTLLRDLGVGLPLQYTVFNVPTEVRNLAASGGGQDIINQLIATGAINQGNVSGIEALIAQLASGQQSIFSQPFATFGGGTTLTGLVVPPATVVASVTRSSLRSLTWTTLRAGDNQPATLHIGSRYPVLNASFAPIFNTPAIAQVLGNLSYQAAFPSFTYEDLGLTFKATPQIHGDSAVTLDTELAMKDLTGQSINGVPVLANREYKGMIRVPDGATAVVVGTISQSEQRSLQGPPLLSLIPGVKHFLSTSHLDKTEDELLITITPHIVREAGPRDTGEIVLQSSGQ